MKVFVLPSIVAVLAATSLQAQAAEAYNWTGIYVGASLGATQSQSGVVIDYNAPSIDNPVGNWTDSNYFTGDVWHDVDGAWLEMDRVEPNSADVDSASLDLGDLMPWLTQIDLENLAVSGTVQAGGQWQFGQFVLGAEVRGTFGEFGTSHSRSWDDDASDQNSDAYCAFFGCAALIRYDDSRTRLGYDSSIPAGEVIPDSEDEATWEGTKGWAPGELMPEPQFVDFMGEVHQDNSLAFGTSYNSYFAPVARAGFAADRWMIFAMGGPALAEVTAWTDASVRETGDLAFEYDKTPLDSTADPDRLSQDAEANYDWSGSNTETLWGYTLGGGVEYAVADNAILRLEGSVTNFGSIDVVGVSGDTDATYTVTQSVTNATVSAGLNFKFN